jgi:RHS repeat-associated protein
MQMPGRKLSGGYRYGFNGKENDNEVKGEGNQQDYGARIYDGRIARWLSGDPLEVKYPSQSPFVYAANIPISAHDPDGKLVIFIGGLRLWHAAFDQDKFFGGGRIHKTDVYNYWSTDKNSFGEKSNIALMFRERLKDHNDYYTSGSSQWDSQAEDRFDDGRMKARTFHAMVESGKIVLAKDETIKVISHSQGGAHAAGYVEQLQSYKDGDGKPLYKVEVIYYITPHQPTDIRHPAGVRGIQYSHPGDPVASDAPWWMPNGGSKFGKINGVNSKDFDGLPENIFSLHTKIILVFEDNIIEPTIVRGPASVRDTLKDPIDINFFLRKDEALEEPFWMRMEGSPSDMVTAFINALVKRLDECKI